MSIVKKILIVVGTRPNIIKITQFKKAAGAFKNIDVKIVHTGQHYDSKMADVFFDQFGLSPDFSLNISSGTANSQTAEIMIALIVERDAIAHGASYVIDGGSVGLKKGVIEVGDADADILGLPQVVSGEGGSRRYQRENREGGNG